MLTYYIMTKSNFDEVKLGGAKRKNGHKSTCSCHICENIKNKAKRGGYTEEMEKKAEYIRGGLKKKNGHRANCKCPICKNMRKKGGQPPDDIDVNSKEKEVVASDDEYDQLENIAGGSRKNKRLLKKSRKTKRRRS